LASRGARAKASDACDRVAHQPVGKRFRVQVAAFSQALSEADYVEGQNVEIDYRWADGQYDRLPEMAARLVGRQVSLIFAGGPAAHVAKTATDDDSPRSIAAKTSVRWVRDPDHDGRCASLQRSSEAAGPFCCPA